MGGKTLNPADAYRKEQRKKDIKKNKQKQAAVKQVTDMLNNPQKIEEEVSNCSSALKICWVYMYLSSLLDYVCRYEKLSKNLTRTDLTRG